MSDHYMPYTNNETDIESLGSPLRSPAGGIGGAGGPGWPGGPGGPGHGGPGGPGW
ncbi:MAG: hypothetical protein H7X86_07100, partial [Gorillibacterium sp.]|nr:hypothetical protein [Gorillibacterium sp.]